MSKGYENDMKYGSIVPEIHPSNLQLLRLLVLVLVLVLIPEARSCQNLGSAHKQSTTISLNFSYNLVR